MKMIDHINKLVKNNQFEHYFLYQHVNRIYKEGYEINTSWVKQDGEGWIFGICANYNYNVYGQNYSQALLDSVIQELDFNKLPEKICFTGNKDLLNKIFAANPRIDYQVYKDRYFYETSIETFKPFKNSKAKVRLAEPKDLGVLAKYSCKFFEEEYSGDNNKRLDDAKITMFRLIITGKLIVGEEDGTLIGFCSKMDTVFENEMIGTVFVESNYRRKDYGKLLLSQMTDIVLRTNKKSWLMTDVNNVVSNNIVERIGYRKIFEYTSGEMRKL